MSKVESIGLTFGDVPKLSDRWIYIDKNPHRIEIPIRNNKQLEKELKKKRKSITYVLDDGAYNPIKLVNQEDIEVKAKNPYKVILKSNTTTNNLWLENSKFIGITGVVMGNAPFGVGAIHLSDKSGNNENIHIKLCSFEGGEGGIFTGANSRKITVEQCFFDIEGNYAWYMLGTGLAVINSIFIDNSNHHLNVRGHYPRGTHGHQKIDVYKGNKYKGSYGEDYWTHLIYRCSILDSSKTPSIDVNPASRGAGIFTYICPSDDYTERTYLPPKNPWVLDNVFKKNIVAPIGLESEYGYPMGSIPKDAYQKGEDAVIQGTTIENNVSDKELFKKERVNTALIEHSNNRTVDMSTYFEEDRITLSRNGEKALYNLGANYRTKNSPKAKEQPKEQPKVDIDIGKVKVEKTKPSKTEAGIISSIIAILNKAIEGLKALLGKKG